MGSSGTYRPVRDTFTPARSGIKEYAVDNEGYMHVVLNKNPEYVIKTNVKRPELEILREEAEEEAKKNPDWKSPEDGPDFWDFYRSKVEKLFSEARVLETYRADEPTGVQPIDDDENE